MKDFLALPTLDSKPRARGLTMLIDNGYATHYFEDVIASHGDWIDYLKFGWGTAYVTKDLQRKIDIAKEHNVTPFFGGTFFEKAYYQNKLSEYCATVKALGLDMLEVSNGTIPLKNEKKSQIIKSLVGDFKIISEVGFKDTEKSQELHPAKWIEYINQDLNAGAFKVITEARESGSSGICRGDGALRYGLINEILDSGIKPNDLVFEAPNKNLQTYFVTRIGHDVNLANISFQEIIALTTLRLGLRGDTFFRFEETKNIDIEL